MAESHKRQKSTLMNGNPPAAVPPVVTTVWGTELGTTLLIGLPQHQ
jgi:hypothetical protein